MMYYIRFYLFAYLDLDIERFFYINVIMIHTMASGIHMILNQLLFIVKDPTIHKKDSIYNIITVIECTLFV